MGPTSLPALVESSYNSSKSANGASKTDAKAQISPLTLNATATETGRVMAEPLSSSHIDAREKREQDRSEAEPGRKLSCKGWKDAGRTDFTDSALLVHVNRSSTTCQDGFDVAQRRKESDGQSSCDRRTGVVSDNVEIADSLNTEDEVTEDLPQVGRLEKETPSQPLSPHLVMCRSEELKGESDGHQSLNDSSEKDECVAMPGKSSVPCFVYGICNTSSFKRRKKETGKCPMGRKSSSLSSSFDNTELASEEHDSLSVIFSVNGYQSVSGSSGKIPEHHFVGTEERSNSSIPLLTSKSSKVDYNDETSDPQISNINSSISSDLALQDEALDLTTFHCRKDVLPSGADAAQNTEHISYVAKFTEEAGGDNAGDGERCQKSSKKGFLSITGLIQKRRTPMMKRYEMKRLVPDKRDKDVSTSEKHLPLELDRLKSASSHPMVKYYQMMQRDSQSMGPSEVDVSNSLGDSCRMMEDEVSYAGSLEQGSTERHHSGVLPHEETETAQPMVKYGQLMHGLPQTTVDSEEELHQDGGDTSSTAQKKGGVSLVTTAEIDTENDPSKRFKCKVCGRGFRHSQGLTAHKKIHSNERPFACQHCDLKFRVKQNLVTHVRTHTGEKPHSCEICGRGFGQQSTLVRHLRSHTGEKPYTCEYCQRKFTQRHVMMNHVRIHTGEKPYSCNVCGKDFKEQHNLVRHVRTHTGEKPYTCEQCGNKFTQKNHLMRHAKVHIPKKHTI